MALKTTVSPKASTSNPEMIGDRKIEEFEFLNTLDLPIHCRWCDAMKVTDLEMPYNQYMPIFIGVAL